jgi:hypothetical protein
MLYKSMYPQRPRSRLNDVTMMLQSEPYGSENPLRRLILWENGHMNCINLNTQSRSTVGHKFDYKPSDHPYIKARLHCQRYLLQIGRVTHHISLFYKINWALMGHMAAMATFQSSIYKLSYWIPYTTTYVADDAVRVHHAKHSKTTESKKLNHESFTALLKLQLP